MNKAIRKLVAALSIAVGAVGMVSSPASAFIYNGSNYIIVSTGFAQNDGNIRFTAGFSNGSYCVGNVNPGLPSTYYAVSCGAAPSAVTYITGHPSYVTGAFYYGLYWAGVFVPKYGSYGNEGSWD